MASASLALLSLSGTLMRSNMTSAPYFLAAMTPSFRVPSSARPRMVITSAPALAMSSTSYPPTSMVLVSATIFIPGNSFLSVRIPSVPSLLMRGVPASSQSTPPATASLAMTTALLIWWRSNAICNAGHMTAVYTYRLKNIARLKIRNARSMPLSSPVYHQDTARKRSSSWHGHIVGSLEIPCWSQTP